MEALNQAFLIMAYTVYILESLIDGSFYIGYTQDIFLRLEQHNAGETKYTSRKKPWKIVYTELMESKSDALKREIFLKKQRSRQFYLSLVHSNM